jgi:hypothetical protein
MRRSKGVTISAVLALIFSVFTVLPGAIFLVSYPFLRKSNPIPNFPPFPENFSFLLFAAATTLLFFGIWGIATGVGLLKLKNWARISILIYAGMLLFFSVPRFLLALVSPMTVGRVFSALFDGVYATLGGFWIYFFNQVTVKAQFSRESPFEGTDPVGAPEQRQPG